MPPSGIRDNHNRGAVGEYLRATIQPGSKLSIVSAYFTIYAYEALKLQLEDSLGTPPVVTRLVVHATN